VLYILDDRPVNEPDRSGTLARRDERFGVDVAIIAGVVTVAFVTDPAKVSVRHRRVQASWAVPQTVNNGVDLKVKRHRTGSQLKNVFCRLLQ
jgi:hypothetical protein